MVRVAQVEDDHLRCLPNSLPNADELIRLQCQVGEPDGLHIDTLTLEL